LPKNIDIYVKKRYIMFCKKHNGVPYSIFWYGDAKV